MLEKKVIEVMGASLFPKLGDVDALDITTMAVTVFSKHYPKGYRPTIEFYASLQGVAFTKEQMDEVYPHAEEFLDWLIDETKKRQ